MNLIGRGQMARVSFLLNESANHRGRSRGSDPRVGQILSLSLQGKVWIETKKTVT